MSQLGGGEKTAGRFFKKKNNLFKIRGPIKHSHTSQKTYTVQFSLKFSLLSFDICFHFKLV